MLGLIDSIARESLQLSDHVANATKLGVANHKLVPFLTAITSYSVCEERNNLGGFPSLVNCF